MNKPPEDKVLYVTDLDGQRGQSNDLPAGNIEKCIMKIFTIGGQTI